MPSGESFDLSGVKLVVFDLDRTLWDHPDISTTSPPYRRVSQDEIEDSEGARIRLRPCARRLVEELKSRGFKLAVASWNLPEPAIKALQALGLLELFDVVVVEPHPSKDLMLEKILRETGVDEEEALFIDDNPSIIGIVKRRYRNMKVIRFRESEPDMFCRIMSKL